MVYCHVICYHTRTDVRREINLNPNQSQYVTARLCAVASLTVSHGSCRQHRNNIQHLKCGIHVLSLSLARSLFSDLMKGLCGIGLTLEGSRFENRIT